MSTKLETTPSTVTVEDTLVTTQEAPFAVEAPHDSVNLTSAEKLSFDEIAKRYFGHEYMGKVIEEVQAREEARAEAEAANLETEEKGSRARRLLGAVGARFGLMQSAVVEQVGKRAAKRKAKYERLKAQEGDSRATRLNKFVRRNKEVVLASGALTAMGAIAAYGVAHGAWNAPTSTSIDAQPLPNVSELPDFTPHQVESIQLAGKETILIGGRGDGSGEGLQAAVNNGVPGVDGGEANKVRYSAGIQNPTAMNEQQLDAASADAAEKAYQMYKNAKGAPVRIAGYSEGTQGAQDAVNRIIAENGGKKPDNLELVLIASPNTPNGAFNMPYVEHPATQAAFGAFGANTERQIPVGTKVIAMDTDFWANSGNKPLTTVLSNAIGLTADGHNVPGNGSLVKAVEVRDGVEYVTYSHATGPQNAALRALEQNQGIKLHPSVDKLAQELAPTGTIAGAPVEVDGQKVVAAAKEAATAHGVPQPVVDAVANAVPGENVATVINEGTKAAESAARGDVVGALQSAGDAASAALGMVPGQNQNGTPANNPIEAIVQQIAPQQNHTPAPTRPQVPNIQQGINDFLGGLGRR